MQPHTPAIAARNGDDHDHQMVNTRSTLPSTPVVAMAEEHDKYMLLDSHNHTLSMAIMMMPAN